MPLFLDKVIKVVSDVPGRFFDPKPLYLNFFSFSTLISKS